jgi:hypothetical protein
MPLLEKYVGNAVTARVNDETLYAPDVAVCGVDLLTTAHGHLA